MDGRLADYLFPCRQMIDTSGSFFRGAENSFDLTNQ
jgi:hypothetical protein